MVPADSIVEDTRTVGLVVEVVRFGQCSQKSASVGAKGTASQQFLHRGREPLRCIARDPAKNRFAVFAHVRAKQGQQFDDDLLRDLRGDLRSLSAAPAAGANLGHKPAMALLAPPLLCQILWRSLGAGGNRSLPLLGNPTLRRRTRVNEALAKQNS